MSLVYTLTFSKWQYRRINSCSWYIYFASPYNKPHSIVWFSVVFSRLRVKTAKQTLRRFIPLFILWEFKLVETKEKVSVLFYFIFGIDEINFNRIRIIRISNRIVFFREKKYWKSQFHSTHEKIFSNFFFLFFVIESAKNMNIFYFPSSCDGRHFIFSYWKFSYHVVIAFTSCV